MTRRGAWCLLLSTKNAACVSMCEDRITGPDVVGETRVEVGDANELLNGREEEMKWWYIRVRGEG